MPWLTFGSETFELRDGETVVGGGADATWRIPAADLNPRHFVVELGSRGAAARPTSTDHVLVVNGRQIGAAPCPLVDGDLIEAGEGTFVYSAGAEPRPPAPMADRVELHLRNERNGVVYRLSERSTTIGRDSSNAVVVRDAVASRFHAEIRREAGGYALHSSGSAGTLLNGRRVGSALLLAPGDRIEIANAHFAVEAGPAPMGAPGPTPSHGIPDAASRRPTVQTSRAHEIGGESGRLWMLVAVLVLLAAAVAALLLIR